MKAPPPTDRPNLETAHKQSWGAWFLQEWGLLLLAAALAIILWEVTSTRVIREMRITDVHVELVVSDADRERVGAVLDDPDVTVTIEMTCSERERFAVLAALTEAGGGTPVLRLKVSAKGGLDERAINDQREVWLWPVDNAAEIEMVAAMPRGRVYRIEGMQQVHIARPQTIPDAVELADLGYKILSTDPDTDPPADIRLDHAFMEFLAPRTILAVGDGGLSMAPDPIDLRALIAEDAPPLGKPQAFTLTFNTWRAAEPYRQRLPLKPVTATLTLMRPERKNFTNRLEVLLHPSLEWDFTSPLGKFVKGTPHQFRGSLRGPKRILDEIESDLAGWMWVMWVAEPAKGWPKTSSMGEDDDGERKNVPARIEWIPLREDWKNKGVRFVPEPGSGEDAFTVKVNRRK